MVNVAILGSGEKILQHYETLSRMKDVSVAGIVDLESQMNCVPADGQDLPVRHLEDLRQTETELIEICVPLEKRALYIKQAARMGFHVVCDMPIAASTEETAAVLNECQKNNVQLYPGRSLRFSPAYVDAKQQISNGAIGHPGVIRLASGGQHPGGDANIFLELGLPKVDWLVWTFGDVDHVLAKHVKTQNTAGHSVEYAATILRMADNSIVHMELSWAQTKDSASFELAGDGGMLSYDSSSSHPINVDKRKPLAKGKSSDDILISSKLEHQLRYFSTCLNTNERRVITGKDVLKAMKVVTAIQESASIGKTVYIERGDSK